MLSVVDATVKKINVSIILPVRFVGQGEQPKDNNN